MPKLLAVVTACIILSACGGGSGSSPALPSVAGPATTQSKANAVATIFIPSKLTSSKRKHPLWISPNTLSIDFGSVVNGTQVAYTAAPLTPTSPNCTGSGGGLTCTVPFAIVPGQQFMTVTVYDTPQPLNGSPLSTVTQQITGVGGITNNYNFTLNGVPAVVYTNSAVPSYQAGTGGFLSVPILAVDADDNAIPGQFDQIINTTPEDTTHTITAAPGQLGISGGTLNVNIGTNPAAATTILNYCSALFTGFCGSATHGPIVITMQLPSNSIYVANTGGASVLAFMSGASGNVPPVRTIPANTHQPFNLTPAGGGGSPAGIFVDSSGNVRYTEPSTNAFLIAPPGVSSTSPITLSQMLGATVGPSTTFNQPKGIVVDGSGSIWVANSAANSLVVTLCCGNHAPVRTVAGALTTLNNPTAVANDLFSSSIFAINNGTTIVKFPWTASGNVAPSATITSASFATPSAIAGAGGKIYVTDSTNNSILVFPDTASGLSVPTTVISGAATGLNAPGGIAVDTSGNMYVANTASSSITVYAFNATGNAAPLRTISGAATGLNAPTGISVRP